MREIVSGIFTWSWFSEPHGYDFNGHLVVYEGDNVCVDPVIASEEDLAFLERAGVDTIALTNRNHVRAANALRARTGARTLIHAADAAYARSQGADIDGELRPGDHIGPFTVIGVPGKSPGEIALHWPARRLLLVGDAVIGNPPGACSLLREQVMDDPARLRRSVRGLLDLEIELLLVGDGVSILERARQRVHELCATFTS